MEFCSYHNGDCEDNTIITIIELKRGKISQIKICQDCFSKRLDEVQLFEITPNSPQEIFDLFLTKKVSQEFIESNLIDSNQVQTPLEKKVKILEKKMAAAVRVEDYETAATIKKEIDNIKREC